jgi:hypothetical protein
MKMPDETIEGSVSDIDRRKERTLIFLLDEVLSCKVTPSSRDSPWDVEIRGAEIDGALVDRDNVTVYVKKKKGTRFVVASKIVTITGKVIKPKGQVRRLLGIIVFALFLTFFFYGLWLTFQGIPRP